MALNGIYDSEAFLALLPGFWLPVVPFAIVGCFLAVPRVRQSLSELACTASAHWLVAVQVLRIAAVGTLIKSLQHAFPLHVELAIGLTDLAYGISALVLFSAVRGGRLSNDALIIWHIVGVLIILIPGELAIQSGLPGTLQAFDGSHSSTPMLDFPMVLAPSLVVPIFMLFNLLGVFSSYLHTAERVHWPISERNPL